MSALWRRFWTFLVDADTKSRYSSCETCDDGPAAEVLAKAGAEDEYVKEEIAGGDVASAV